MRISTVKLVISFCANAKFKDITCIVNHHYHICHMPRRFYSVNESWSIVFQLHMIPALYIELPVDTAPGKINCMVSNLASKYTGRRNFTACIV